MKYLALILASVFLAMAAGAGAQSAIPDNPDSLFDQPSADQPSAPAAPAPTPVAAVALNAARGVEVGGYLYSDYTGFLKWTRAYPDPADVRAGASSLFVP